MSGLLGQFVENFKKGRDAAYVERGFRQGEKPAPETDAAETSTEGDGEADGNSVVSKLAETVKTLRDSNKALETERDDANKLLREAADESDGRKQRIEALETDLADQKKQNKKLRSDNTTKTKLVEKLSATVTALQTRVGEVEDERGTLAAALAIPGMDKIMRKVAHQDAHPEAGEDRRQQLTEWSQTVNAAFALLKRLTDKPDEREQ